MNHSVRFPSLTFSTCNFQGEVSDYFLVEPDRALFFPSVDLIRTALTTKTAPNNAAANSNSSKNSKLISDKFEIQVKYIWTLFKCTTSKAYAYWHNHGSVNAMVNRRSLRLTVSWLVLLKMFATNVIYLQLYLSNKITCVHMGSNLGGSPLHTLDIIIMQFEEKT